MERRRSREHELRQPGSLFLIGPEPRSLEHCVLALHLFLFLYQNVFSVSTYGEELRNTLVGLTDLNGEFNCRPRNR